MMNIYARTFMIATMTDATEPAEMPVKRRGPGWIRRARRWAASRSHSGT